jgi:long-chain acyl-CoA synthetase
MNFTEFLFYESRYLGKNLVIGPKEIISYDKIWDDIEHLSEYIRHSIGENQNVILINPNSIFFIVAYFSIMKSGNVCVPLNPDIEKTNLEYIKNKCLSPLCFISKKAFENYGLSVINNIDEEKYKSILDSPLSNSGAFGSKEFDDNRLAEIIFTSGSTGEPKGVMLSHKNLIANTTSIIKYLNLGTSDIMEIVLPFYYCYGLSLLHTHVKVGGSIVLNSSFIFLGTFLEELKRYKCTGFAGVPSHFQILLRKTKNFKTSDFPDLRYVTQAGGKLHNVFISEFKEAFPNIDFFVMYGQTEATARLSYLAPSELDRKIGSIGKAIPGVQLEIINEQGIPAREFENGELIARGENVMMGYYQDNESTISSLKDRWLYTGDIGYRDDDGYIFLVARKKEILKVGGKRISPKEIEEVICSITEVVDCTVEGVEDELLGEAIKATIILNDIKETKLSKESIKKLCSERLAIYKVPQIIVFEEYMNVNSVGKKVKVIK